MAGLFGIGAKEETKPSIVPEVKAQAPVDPPRRSSEETASLAAEQTERFTRRRGRAFSMLTGGSGTGGGISAGRMLGSTART